MEHRQKRARTYRPWLKALAGSLALASTCFSTGAVSRDTDGGRRPAPSSEQSRGSHEQSGRDSDSSSQRGGEQSSQEGSRQSSGQDGGGGNGGGGGSANLQPPTSSTRSGDDRGGGSGDAGGGSGSSGTSGSSSRSGDRSGGENGGNRNRPDAAKVPGTVAEWLDDIFKPSKTIAPAAPSQAAPKSKAATGAGRPVPRDAVASDLFGRPELLTARLSAPDLARAVSLGFATNGNVRASGLNLSLTRLLAPSGVSAENALQMLRDSLPDQDIGINQKYRIYHPSNGAIPADHESTTRDAVPMATPCGTDRCFGPSIINWQPALKECAKSVRIGVIDTGSDLSHPAFKNKTIETRRLSPQLRAKSPDWHGTGVLALLAGEERSGTPGLIPGARFYLADIFYADADGSPASDTASIIEALAWLKSMKADVINMSFSGPPDDNMKRAIDELTSDGILLVAAAGNDGPAAPPSYPAAYDPVIAVTAVNKDLLSYRHASRGDHIDVAAPGVDIWTAQPGGLGTYHSGTSFAVPYVTAVLAVIHNQLKPRTKASFLDSIATLDLGDPGRDPIYGNGLVLAPLSCVPLPASNPHHKPAETAQAAPQQ